MKTILLLFATVLFSQNCSKQVGDYTIQKTFPASIQEVYFQNWVAGVQGGGAGTYFYIEFKEKLSKDINLHQVYFRNKKSVVKQESEKLYNVLFLSEANQRTETGSSDENQQKSDATVIHPPFPINENEAVLEYSYKGKKQWYKLTDVKEHEMLAYPSARPGN